MLPTVKNAVLIGINKQAALRPFDPFDKLRAGRLRTGKAAPQ